MSTLGFAEMRRSPVLKFLRFAIAALFQFQETSFSPSRGAKEPRSQLKRPDAEEASGANAPPVGAVRSTGMRPIWYD